MEEILQLLKDNASRAKEILASLTPDYHQKISLQ